MKRFFVFVIASLLFFGAGISSKAFATEGLKIGIVDLFRALNESDEGKKATSELESLIKSKQTLLEEKGKKIETMKGELEKQSAVLSAEAKKAKEEEIERLIRDYQRLMSDSQSEVKKKEAELTDKILKELRQLINTMSQEQGYTLILERAEGLILYADKSIDITDALIKRYNESKAKTK